MEVEKQLNRIHLTAFMEDKKRLATRNCIDAFHGFQLWLRFIVRGLSCVPATLAVSFEEIQAH